MKIAYTYQPETTKALESLRATCPGTIALQSAEFGAKEAEPLLVMIDAAIRYAQAYQARFDQRIGDDYVARPEFSGILSGIRGMLNFDGAAAWEAGKSRDSKDNGMIESLYWTACEIAGIDGESI